MDGTEVFLVKEGKAHFLYLAQTQPPRQHYLRYHLKTGKRDLDVFPRFQGSRISIRGLDGFFATRPSEPGSTLYCVGREETEARLACLASDDNGRTWQDHALSEKVENPYAIGGAREPAGDGSIIGSFTDQVAPTTESGGGAKVYFFKIPGGRRPAAGGRPLRIAPRYMGAPASAWVAGDRPDAGQCPFPDAPLSQTSSGSLDPSEGAGEKYPWPEICS